MKLSDYQLKKNRYGHSVVLLNGQEIQDYTEFNRLVKEEETKALAKLVYGNASAIIRFRQIYKDTQAHSNSFQLDDLIEMYKNNRDQLDSGIYAGFHSVVDDYKTKKQEADAIGNKVDKLLKKYNRTNDKEIHRLLDQYVRLAGGGFTKDISVLVQQVKEYGTLFPQKLHDLALGK